MTLAAASHRGTLRCFSSGPPVVRAFRPLRRGTHLVDDHYFLTIESLAGEFTPTPAAHSRVPAGLVVVNTPEVALRVVPQASPTARVVQRLGAVGSN